MNPYYSKKWTLFTERPIPLLKRDLMSRCYYNLSSLSRFLPGFNISKLLVIGRENNNLVFVPAVEENKNYCLARTIISNGKLSELLTDFMRMIKRFKNPKKSALAAAKYYFEYFGSILVSTFYFEKVLGGVDIGLTASERDKLVGRVSRLRDLGAKKMYPGYDIACRYFSRLFPRQDFTYGLSAELERGVLNDEEINRRKKFYVAVFNHRQAKIYVGRAGRGLLEKEGFKRIKIRNFQMVRGTVASRGQVQAEAVLIFHLGDFKKKFTVNKVVVCPETVIEYVPYLKKARALVTDHGGLACHAAVTARELGIPCIVGTKIATKIFKDGDLVEVDANEGAVRRIK